MNIREIMTNDPAVCPPMAKLEDVAKLMVEKNCGAVPIVNDILERKPVGIITDRDIACRMVAKAADPSNVRAKDIMTPHPIVLGPDLTVEDCINAMEKFSIRRILVVDPMGSCIGIVAQADIARSALPFETAELVKEVSGPRRAAITA